MKTSRIVGVLALALLISSSALSASALSSYVSSLTDQAKIKLVESDMKSISVALDMFKLNAGAYPTAVQGLKSLEEKPVTDPVPRRWVQIMDKVPKDPWGHEYRYAVREKDGKITHIIFSDGPNLLDPADNIEHPLEKE